MIWSVPINTKTNRKAGWLSWKDQQVGELEWEIGFCYLRIQLLFTLDFRRNSTSAFLHISVTSACNLVTTRAALCQLIKVQREKACCFGLFSKYEQAISHPKTFLFEEFIVISSHLRLCQVLQAALFRWLVFSIGEEVRGGKESVHVEWRNLTKFGSPGNFIIWLGLKLMYINQSEPKSFSISALS